MADDLTRPAVSERVAGLIRTGVTRLLEAPAELFEDIDSATLGAVGESLAADPELADAIRAGNRTNMTHWATANLRAPGVPVDPNPGAADGVLAREIVRRGFDEEVLTTYRIGQNLAWQYWMDLAFELTSDPDELREMLDVTSASIFDFVDRTILRFQEEIDRERERLKGGSQMARLEVVNLILEGSPITSRRASERLGYELARTHTAAIISGAEGRTVAGDLERVAKALALGAGSHRPFTHVSGANSLWAWVSGAEKPDLDPVRQALAELPTVRVAIGSTETGIEGFRKSHLDALATRSILNRGESTAQLATFDEIQLVALATSDEERSAAFVSQVLGELATATPELRRTLRVFLREGSSATRAAGALFTHRNTVLNRVNKARSLLPADMEQNVVHVAIALEIVRWLGPPSLPRVISGPGAVR